MAKMPYDSEGRLRTKRLAKFNDDGTLRTAFSDKLAAVSRVDRVTGRPRTDYETTLTNASRVDRASGLPKEAQ